MKRFLILFVVLSAINIANGQGNLCDSTARGLYFFTPYAHQLPVLYPSMPYDIFVGYVYADSIMRAYTNFVLEDSINAIDLDSDTMSYLLKYMYRLGDYSPILYEQFIGMSAKSKPFKRSSGMFIQGFILNHIQHLEIRYNIERYLTRLLVEATYIYHINVVDTAFISDRKYPSRIVYSTILDNIKGQKMPHEEYVINPIVLTGNNPMNTATINFLNNHQNYFAFEFLDTWHRRAFLPYVLNGQIVGTRVFNKPLKDSNGNPWIVPNREYIVFAAASGSSKCGYKTSGLNSCNIFPITGNTSCGMLPIINGNVIDEENNLGFGERVPVGLFKQLLREKIDLIKSYGE